MSEDNKSLQALSDEYQKLQDDLQTTIDARQRLEAQQAENLSVSKEFALLSIESSIYKLVGPVLLKQDKTDAVSAVNGRLDFIGKEITRTEARIQELQDGSEKRRVEVMQIQQRLQSAQEQGQAAA